MPLQLSALMWGMPIPVRRMSALNVGSGASSSLPHAATRATVARASAVSGALPRKNKRCMESPFDCMERRRIGSRFAAGLN